MTMIKGKRSKLFRPPALFLGFRLLIHRLVILRRFRLFLFLRSSFRLWLSDRLSLVKARLLVWSKSIAADYSWFACKQYKITQLREYIELVELLMVWLYLKLPKTIMANNLFLFVTGTWFLCGNDMGIHKLGWVFQYGCQASYLCFMLCLHLLFFCCSVTLKSLIACLWEILPIQLSLLQLVGKL